MNARIVAGKVGFSIDYTHVKTEHELAERATSVEAAVVPEAKNEGLAAVLSVLLPGVGQIYTGHFIWAIIWFIITPGFWIGTGGTFGFVFNILASIQAYRQATRKNEEFRQAIG